MSQVQPPPETETKKNRLDPALIAGRVYTHLVKIYKHVTPGTVVENAREMRFALRLIVSGWLDLIEAGATSRPAYTWQALRSVDPRDEGVQDVRFQTATVLKKVLERADWITRPEVHSKIESAERQTNNVTMHRVYEGIKYTLKELDDVLEKDGSKDREFSDAELSEEEDDYQPINTSSTDTSKYNQGHGWLAWTEAEEGQLRKIQEDQAKATWEQKTAELHKRMTNIRTLNGVSQKPSRTANAVRRHWKHLSDKKAIK